MKKSAILFLILLLSLTLFGQNKKTERTALLENLLKQTKSLVLDDPAICIQYAETGIIEAKKSDLPKFEAEFYLVIGQAYKSMKYHDKQIEAYKRALIVYSKLKDDYGKITVINKIAEYDYFRFHLDDAADWYKQSIKLYKKNNDRTGEMEGLYALAIIYYDADDFKKAYSYLSQADEIKDELVKMMSNDAPNVKDVLNKDQRNRLKELIQKQKLDENKKKSSKKRPNKPQVTYVNDTKKEKELEEKLKLTAGEMKAKNNQLSKLMSKLTDSENELYQEMITKQLNEDKMKALRGRNFLLILILVIVVLNMVLIIRSYLGKVRSNNELLRAHEVIKSKNFEITKAYDQIEKISRIDPLTKVFNRRDMEEKMLNAVNLFEREMNPFSFLIIDIDLFKNVNDTYGHDGGDYVLKTLSALLKTSLRKIDTISRWGGEEFLVLLNKTTEEGAGVAAEKLRKAVEDFRFEYNDNSFAITVTVGYSTFDELREVHEVIKEADLALYEGKQNGRNQSNKFKG
ncbi:MAG: GGDEF domain-containing protein [Candidatus Zophobacter franzmannii]|nr:GGDEF domain-containing protein [Candidatus Zophobacter franzmannii]